MTILVICFLGLTQAHHSHEGGSPAFSCGGDFLDSRLRGNDDCGGKSRASGASPVHSCVSPAYNTTMLSRFFCPAPLSLDSPVVTLSENAARHACRVLRLRAGDALRLFDGRGGEYAAQIVAAERDQVTVELLEHVLIERESPLFVTLVQALQTGDKMDWTIQKAVELGVARVVPVSARRSLLRLSGERALRRAAHWQQVALAACEQCGRNRVPEIAPLQNLEQWLAQSAAADVLRLILLPDAEQSLHALKLPAANTRIELLIGSEAGWDPEEISLAKQAAYLPLRLGPRVLRTETAGLAALAALQCLWGDF